MPNRTCVFQSLSWLIHRFMHVLVMSCCAVPARFSWYRIYSRLFALLTMWSTWAFSVNFAGSLQKQVIIAFIFEVLFFIRFSLVHLKLRSRESCKADVEFGAHVSNNVPSSTCLRTGQGGLMSFSCTKNIGPLTVPCGTPPLAESRGGVDRDLQFSVC